MSGADISKVLAASASRPPHRGCSRTPWHGCPHELPAPAHCEPSVAPRMSALRLSWHTTGVFHPWTTGRGGACLTSVFTARLIGQQECRQNQCILINGWINEWTKDVVWKTMGFSQPLKRFSRNSFMNPNNHTPQILIRYCLTFGTKTQALGKFSCCDGYSASLSLTIDPSSTQLCPALCLGGEVFGCIIKASSTSGLRWGLATESLTDLGIGRKKGQGISSPPSPCLGHVVLPLPKFQPSLTWSDGWEQFPLPWGIPCTRWLS